MWNKGLQQHQLYLYYCGAILPMEVACHHWCCGLGLDQWGALVWVNLLSMAMAKNKNKNLLLTSAKIKTALTLHINGHFFAWNDRLQSHCALWQGDIADGCFMLPLMLWVGIRLAGCISMGESVVDGNGKKSKINCCSQSQKLKQHQHYVVMGNLLLDIAHCRCCYVFKLKWPLYESIVHRKLAKKGEIQHFFTHLRLWIMLAHC